MSAPAELWMVMNNQSFPIEVRVSKDLAESVRAWCESNQNGGPYTIARYIRSDDKPGTDAVVLDADTPAKTLRDEFAMAALTGLCANADTGIEPKQVLVALAYSRADAMMKERAR